MFFYLSFLRPPPAESSPFGSIKITPQICNDLRTELYPKPQDLYYAWALCDPSSSSNASASSLRLTTQPAKLTTWKSSNAYKDIPVPLPTSVRDGQWWRLVLMSSGLRRGVEHPEWVDLSSTDEGSESQGTVAPLSVISAPIWMKGNMKTGKKLEKIERIYKLAGPDELTLDGQEKDSELLLKFVEATSFDLDKKIWDSGIGLASWLSKVRRSTQPSVIAETLFHKDPRVVVELGAGIGIGSIALAALRSVKEDKVFVTDVETAMPLLECNLECNRDACASQPIPLVLDWDEELPEEITSLGRIDIVIMADVTYNTASFPSLLSTLLKLCAIGSPLIVFGYKERDAAEREWFNMAAEKGLHFTQIGQRRGAGGASVEIWAGSKE